MLYGWPSLQSLNHDPSCFFSFQRCTTPPYFIPVICVLLSQMPSIRSQPQASDGHGHEDVGTVLHKNGTVGKCFFLIVRHSLHFVGRMGKVRGQSHASGDSRIQTGRTRKLAFGRCSRIGISCSIAFGRVCRACLRRNTGQWMHGGGEPVAIALFKQGTSLSKFFSFFQ